LTVDRSSAGLDWKIVLLFVLTVIRAVRLRIGQA
jgi:hypothetical protein